jgi:hypothetical protein
MFTPSGRELDPQLFEKANETKYIDGVSQAAQVWDIATEAINSRDAFNPETTSAALINELKDSYGEAWEAAVEEIAERPEAAGKTDDELDEICAREVFGWVKEEGHPIDDEKYTIAVQQQELATTQAVDYICGYQATLQGNLATAYQIDLENPAEAATLAEDSWRGTWNTLRRALGDAEGTPLASLVGLIDGLVRKEFGDTYDPMRDDRGDAVSTNVAARTFYEVMRPHLARANVEDNEDGWTGWER